MDGITELALLFKARENKNEYSPMFGRVLELPRLKISIGNHIIITAEQVVCCTALRHNDEYTDVGKQVVLLPYDNYQHYILIGVVQ